MQDSLARPYVSRKCFAAMRTSFAAMMMWSILGKVSAAMVRWRSEGPRTRRSKSGEEEQRMSWCADPLETIRMMPRPSDTIPARLRVEVHFLSGGDALAGQAQKQTWPDMRCSVPELNEARRAVSMPSGCAAQHRTSTCRCRQH